jgi:hypothetical protein
MDGERRSKIAGPEVERSILHLVGLRMSFIGGPCSLKYRKIKATSDRAETAWVSSTKAIV